MTTERYFRYRISQLSWYVYPLHSFFCVGLRYDTTEEFNVDSKAECDQLNLANETKTKRQCSLQMSSTVLNPGVDCCRFRVRSAPYEAARANANSTSAPGNALSDFERRTSFFPVLVTILRAVIPCVVVVLLLHAAYLYTRYISSCVNLN